MTIIYDNYACLNFRYFQVQIWNKNAIWPGLWASWLMTTLLIPVSATASNSNKSIYRRISPLSESPGNKCRKVFFKHQNYMQLLHPCLIHKAPTSLAIVYFLKYCMLYRNTFLFKVGLFSTFFCNTFLLEKFSVHNWLNKLRNISK